jgi:hypothetical protein
VVLALAAPIAVWAQSEDLVDGNDTRGLMDAKRVEFRTGERPRWTFITFARWDAARVWDRGFLLVNLDSFGDARFDYYALVRSDGHRLLGDLWRDRRKKDDFRIAKLRVFRRNKRSVTVRVRLAKLRTSDRRPYYRWVAKTLMVGGKCRTVCIDRIPDDGSKQQLLPGVVLTPTVSPTPTPTVEPTPSGSP